MNDDVTRIICEFLEATYASLIEDLNKKTSMQTL